MVCDLRSDRAGHGIRHRRPAFSLLEVVVVIAIIGVLAMVVGLAPRTSASTAKDDSGSAAAIIASARRSSLAAGVAVTVRARSRDGVVTIAALPDGRIVGAEAWGFDPLTARRVQGSTGRGVTQPDSRMNDSSRGPSRGQ